ncbi:MAG: hypothetical protein IT337_09195 [Thermomicrobiales bacterium]|nr:hypothetical protein [Thermomicrobiales bacterium]
MARVLFGAQLLAGRPAVPAFGAMRPIRRHDYCFFEVRLPYLRGARSGMGADPPASHRE